MWKGFQEPASGCAEGGQHRDLRAVQLVSAVHKVHRLTPIPNELDAFHTVHGVFVEQGQDGSLSKSPQGVVGGYALNFKLQKS